MPASGTSRWPVWTLVALSAVVAACLVYFLPPPIPREPSKPAAFEPASLDRSLPPFELLDQAGEKVTLDSLKGKYWVASFIFTRCRGICPTVSATMARLRDELPADVLLVSFSVDPKYDTPAVLAEYAKQFGVHDPSRWKFLTGDRETIYKLSRDGFLLVVEENKDPKADPGDLVTHTSRVVIVDEEGKARTTYNSLDPSSVDLIKRSIERLRKKDKETG